MRTAALVFLLAACDFHTTPAGDSSGPAPAARRQADVIAGAGRVKTGKITIDVEVGRAVPIAKVNAGTVSITGTTVVSP